LYSFLWALKKPKRFIDVYNGKEEISVYNGMFTVDSGRHVELTICKNYAAYLDDIIYRTDLVSNFFIAKTESIRAVGGWQPEHVKVGEHQAFFLRLKLQGAKVAFTRCFGVKHYPRKTLRYNRYRLRTSRMFKESLQYLNVDSYVIKNDMGEVVFVYKKEAT